MLCLAMLCLAVLLLNYNSTKIEQSADLGCLE